MSEQKGLHYMVPQETSLSPKIKICFFKLRLSLFTSGYLSQVKFLSQPHTSPTYQQLEMSGDTLSFFLLFLQAKKSKLMKKGE